MIMVSMRSRTLAGTKPTSSTQQYLDIAEIRDDVVVMKDGTLRAVLLVSSINFALKSEEEQDATISAYMGFLNSLDFSLQIVIQSRKLNIDQYLAKLADMVVIQTNDLLKTQTSEYREFIAELVELGDIMSKRFYVVIPFAPGSDKQRGFISRLSQVLTPSRVMSISQKYFLDMKESLMKQVEYIISGLAGVGLSCAVLDTQSLIELYYNSYNQEMMRAQPMIEENKLQIENN